MADIQMLQFLLICNTVKKIYLKKQICELFNCRFFIEDSVVYIPKTINIKMVFQNLLKSKNKKTKAEFPNCPMHTRVLLEVFSSMIQWYIYIRETII